MGSQKELLRQVGLFMGSQKELLRQVGLPINGQKKPINGQKKDCIAQIKIRIMHSTDKEKDTHHE